MELGAADDLVFDTTNSKQKEGSVGQLTHGVIDRKNFYEQAVVLAFIRFQWPELYSEN
jgi:non-canonical (house-cleaning) NTP pyrophosphatase